MLTGQRKQLILEKLAEKGTSKKVNAALNVAGKNLGFGAVKANKQTAKTVPGPEVLHSGGKWAQGALAQQEARIGIRPNLPAPMLQKQANLFTKLLKLKKKGKAAAPKKTRLDQIEARLGISPGQITTGNTRQWARTNAR